MSELQDPIWEVMDLQGRSLVWLAQRIPVSESYLRAMKARKIAPTPEVRARAADILQVPERLLFLADEPVHA